MTNIRGNLGGTPWRYGGRSFSEAEIETIRTITDDPWCTTQTAIARAVCTALQWVTPAGQPKVETCRTALQQMEADGVIWLPLPTRAPAAPSPAAPAYPPASDPQAPITGSRGDLADLRLDLVVPDSTATKLWSALMVRYHPLHSARMAGAQVRYLAYDGDRLLGALGFGAAALKLAARDRFIGWTAAERTAHLHQVVENRRFLVLPWVQVKGLASSLLGLTARRLGPDWQERYAYRPVFVETFVEHGRYAGTAYKAANWVCLGPTQGQGRLAPSGRTPHAVRDLWVYALDPHFRAVLTDGRRTERWSPGTGGEGG